MKLRLQVDLFFYREPEEAKEQQEDDGAIAADYTDYAAGALGMGDQWSSQIPDAQWAGDMATPPISGAPVAAGGWTGADGKELRTSLFNYFLYVCSFVSSFKFLDSMFYFCVYQCYCCFFKLVFLTFSSSIWCGWVGSCCCSCTSSRRW